ncbi:MAG TPA: O-antigen translocase [Puia sp.]|nr:O-antigen translocase [Puia sp.]
MILKLKKVFSSDLVKVSSLNAVATLIRMMTGFISVKVVAVLIGPPGVALLGQLNNFSSILLSLSAGGINTGVTKHIAQYSDSPRRYVLFLSTAFWITAALSVLCGIVLIVGGGYFSLSILKDIQYRSVFQIFGITIILYAMNALLVAIINGFSEFRKYVIVNIAGSLLGLLFTVILSLSFGIYGALLALVTYQSAIFFVTLSLVAKSRWFSWKSFVGRFSKTAAKRLGHYSLMALASAILVPVSQLFVRDFIAARQSLNDAGLWEGINRISNMYLLVITTSFSVYYLPRLSGLKTDQAVREEVFRVYKVLIPFLAITLSLIYLFRHLIIHILFNHRFIGMEDLFAYQLIGDFLKMGFWTLGYLFLARAMTNYYILMEFFGSALYVVLCHYFIRSQGALGATIAFSISSGITLLVHLFIFRKLLFGYER